MQNPSPLFFLSDHNNCNANKLTLMENISPVILDDVCLLPAEVGPCRSLKPKFFFNAKSGQCEQFKYGGCDDNGNSFDSKPDCEKRLVNLQACIYMRAFTSMLL